MKLALLAAASILVAFTSQGDDGLLLSFRDGNKWGFMTTNGSVVVSPFFLSTDGSFSEGRVAVSVGRKWGYIDNKGCSVIPAIFDDARSFRAGMARVGFYVTEPSTIMPGEGGIRMKYGYIDRDGRLLVPPRYAEHSGDYNEGLALVVAKEERTNELWLYVDKAGRASLGPFTNYCGSFCEGLAARRVGAKVGYMDRRGKMVIKPEFDNAGDFSQGLAPAGRAGKWGYIDRRGRWIIEPEFDMVAGFAEGYGCVQREGKWGFVTRRGVLAIGLLFDWAWPFSQEIACVRIKDLWGYIDPSGQWVVRPQFSDAMPFSGGFAHVWKGQEAVWIDRQGKTVEVRGSQRGRAAREVTSGH
jgi:hypothetical protein